MQVLTDPLYTHAKVGGLKPRYLVLSLIPLFICSIFNWQMLGLVSLAAIVLLVGVFFGQLLLLEKLAEKNLLPRDVLKTPE